jgi:hypothetical protein
LQLSRWSCEITTNSFKKRYTFFFTRFLTNHNNIRLEKVFSFNNLYDFSKVIVPLYFFETSKEQALLQPDCAPKLLFLKKVIKLRKTLTGVPCYLLYLTLGMSISPTFLKQLLKIYAEGRTLLYKQISLIRTCSFALNVMSLIVTWNLIPPANIQPCLCRHPY